MSKSHRHAITVTDNGGSQVATDDTFTGSGENNVSESIASSQTDKLVNWQCDVSTLKSIIIKVSGACVIETNSGSAADNTFTFAAAGALIWNNLMPTEVACPLTVDVTKLYVTCTPAVTLEITSLVDATP